MDMTFLIILIVFGITALAEFILGIISIRRTISESNRQTSIIIPISDKTDNAEYILRQAQKMAEQSDFPCRCIITSYGANVETLEICRRFANKFGYFEIEEIRESE